MYLHNCHQKYFVLFTAYIHRREPLIMPIPNNNNVIKCTNCMENSWIISFLCMCGCARACDNQSMIAFSIFNAYCSYNLNSLCSLDHVSNYSPDPSSSSSSARKKPYRIKLIDTSNNGYNQNLWLIWEGWTTFHFHLALIEIKDKNGLIIFFFADFTIQSIQMLGTNDKTIFYWVKRFFETLLFSFALLKLKGTQ